MLKTPPPCRRAGDFARNDDVYDAMDAKEAELAAELARKKAMDADAARQPRTPAEMAAEAAALRPLFK
jgi:bis(5'-adenosyl)-triphosphatase